VCGRVSSVSAALAPPPHRETRRANPPPDAERLRIRWHGIIGEMAKSNMRRRRGVRRAGASAVELAVGELRAALFEGRIEPGTPLRETHLASWLGISRSTVREALKILVQDGLARHTHNKGVVVTSLTGADVEEIYRARLILEVAGIRAITEEPRPSTIPLRDALASYENAVRIRDQQAAVAAHLGFHCAIVGLLGSSRLSACADALVADVRLAMAAAARTSNDSPQQVTAHAMLLKLIEHDEVDDAVAELTDHLSRGKAALAARIP
jgi:DNA-binding GntR family transcriptional regulator